MYCAACVPYVCVFVRAYRSGLAWRVRICAALCISHSNVFARTTDSNRHRLINIFMDSASERVQPMSRRVPMSADAHYTSARARALHIPFGFLQLRCAQIDTAAPPGHCQSGRVYTPTHVERRARCIVHRMLFIQARKFAHAVRLVNVYD